MSKTLVRLLTLVLAMTIGIVGCVKESATTPSDTTPAQTTSATTDSDSQDTSPITPDESVEQELTGVDIGDTLNSKIKLHFNSNGEFKVLILADMHLRSSGLPEYMGESLETLINREDPDLIIMTGDNVADKSIKTAEAFEKTLRQVVDYIEERQIPWMHVYGNHDSEGSFSRESQQAVYESFEYCISKTGEDLTGVGNYVIPLYASDSDELKFAFWGIDSGAYMSAADAAELSPIKSTFGGYSDIKYDYIHEDQIEWYLNTSKLLEEYNNGKKVPGLMAFHIPLQETWTAWENRDGLEFTGEKRDPICSSSYNSGLFAALRMRGDIKAVVNGHDHINDFMVNYGGVKLCYSPSFTTTAYSNQDMHGSRVFVINESNPSDVKTYVSYVEDRGNIQDADPFNVGYTYDFEGTAPEFKLTGWPNSNASECYVSEIKAEIVGGAGLNGSNALGITRTAYHSNNSGNNLEVKWSLDTPGTIGENEYFMVWMDLSTNNLDFRKAAFGLIANNAYGSPYTTDDYDATCEFYYKADGTDTWIKLSMGKDGCFGAGDGCSVAGFKGWFAFSIKHMINGNLAINSNTVITGVYFYMCFSSSEMAGKYVYVDNIMLVKDYTAY